MEEPLPALRQWPRCRMSPRTRADPIQIGAPGEDLLAGAEEAAILLRCNRRSMLPYFAVTICRDVPQLSQPPLLSPAELRPGAPQLSVRRFPNISLSLIRVVLSILDWRCIALPPMKRRCKRVARGTRGARTLSIFSICSARLRLPAQRFVPDLPLEGDGFRTIGTPATAERRCGWRPQRCSRRRRSRRPSADFLVPRGHAFGGHTESKNPVEFRPWSYEFDGNRNARAM